MNIVIKNPMKKFDASYSTAPDDLSCTGTLDARRFATIHVQSLTVAGYTWKEHNHADRHVGMTCNPCKKNSRSKRLAEKHTASACEKCRSATTTMAF